MYRFLLTRQWVSLTLVALLLIPVMVRLGFWQLHRHEARVAHNTLVERNLSAEPVPVTSLTAPGHRVEKDDYWRSVTATGTFDTADEVVIRQRTAPDGDRIGYFVLTPFLLDDGRAVLVNRGWIRGGNDLHAFPEAPAPPAGQVTVTGRLMGDETTEASGIKDKQGLPERQYMLINSAQQAERLDRRVLGGYVELVEPAAESPAPVPAPDHDSIGVNMAYAVQWWLFAAGVPVGWVVLLRRELADRRRGVAVAERDEAVPVPS
ncbi:SURF1 family cytochrome oxidase biogenesis protein [Streptomyces zingiberis]|uniref:SURF1-like protein n=1 Tax=Streptomyces zingiberis TaxID=2053010 RepID=A0ABX1C2E8_9ACTN|nr:SURF1 family protein [Streptomyces zingiberis]NJQ02097.1 SURF1 family protein [Streptomyces zingiberis]